MSALSDPDNVWLVPVTDQGAGGRTVERRGLTNEEAYALLTGGPNALAAALTVPDGDDDSDADVAAEHSGAMIALLPSLEDQQRLALDGGEQAEHLHVTLQYLGPAANWNLAMQAQLIDAVSNAVATWYACQATAFGAAIWNPDGTDPCVVLQLDGGGLEYLRDCVCAAISTWEPWMPAQHEPWAPHVALAYTDQLTSLSQALQRVGPITLDRIRVAFAGQNVDLQLQSMPPLPSDVTTAGGPVTTRTVNLTDAPPAASGTGDAGTAPVGNTDVPGSTPVFSGGTPWYGVLVVEGVETGDGRMFEPGSLTWIDGGGQPLSWAPENLGQHDGSMVAARIDRMWRDLTDPNIIWGMGVFDDAGSAGSEALRLVSGNFMNGVSVDVDSIKDADVELVWPEGSGDDELMDLFAAPELTIFHAGRIRGATIVAIPAFVEATIQLGTPPENLLTAAPMTSGTGYSIEQIIPHGCGTMTDLNACVAGMGALATRTDLNLTIDQRRSAYAHLAAHITGFNLVAPDFTPTDEVQALTASADEHPPLWMFQDPGFTEPTAMTVLEPDANGWVHLKGHAALWSTCHTSFPNACVTAPFEREGQTHFTLGEMMTASGERVAVGTIAMGTGHAPTVGYDPRRAVEHYDNTGTAVALVATGNDDHGIWFSGIVKPGTPPGRVMELAAAKLSGDWRRVAGQMRMVALLAVNTPGFPVPRVKAQVVDGVQASLVAAGVLPDRSELRRRTDQPALRQVAASLQRRLGRDPKTLAAQLRKRVHPTSKES